MKILKKEPGGKFHSKEIENTLEALQEEVGGETNAQLFEQTFGEKDVVLFGEGYGKKIQKVGAEYIPDGVDFILFDVMVGDYYLRRPEVVEIASCFGVKCVPIVLCGDIDAAVEFVKKKPMSTIGIAPMEGLVGRPPVELRDQCGSRLIVKIKARDFE